MNSRDIELLSAYLDGELSPSDSARVELRINSDGELASALDDLRAARTLLRKLPKRRAPRNFTLTRKMVGLNPPLPRAYPAFRFATVIATLLFFFTFGLNTLAPQLAQVPVFGMGGGGEPEVFSQQAPALEAAPATEAPATEAPAATEESIVAASGPAPEATAQAPAEDSARVVDTPVAKDGVVGNAGDESQTQIMNEPQSPAPFIPSVWLTAFALIAILGAVLMAAMRRSSANRWK